MNTLQKISTTSKHVAAIFRIARIACIVLASVLIIAIIVLSTNPDARIAFGDSLKEGSFLLTMVTPGADVSIVPGLNMLLTACAFGILAFAMYFGLFGELVKLFRTMAEGVSPFAQSVVARVKRIGLFTLLVFLVSNAMSIVFAGIFTGKWGFSLDFSLLILCIVVYCLGMIFEYGCQLQQQSDETL